MSDQTLFPDTEAVTLPALVYQGVTLRERDGMICLTDMWKADGARSSRRPAHWRQFEATQRLIDKVQETVRQDASNIFATSEGRHGGTWAHWQLAIAYAQYLSPEFHMWCNKMIRAYMEGTVVSAQASAPAGDTQARLAALEARVEALAQIDFRKEVAVPIMSYLHRNLQNGYLDARFYKIAERQHDDRGILETIVDDMTRLRTQMNDLMGVVQARRPVEDQAAPAFLSINEVFAKLRIGHKRPNGLPHSMSRSLLSWCEANRRGIKRRTISGNVVRCFYEDTAVDQWWEESGAKIYGRYVDKVR